MTPDQIRKIINQRRKALAESVPEPVARYPDHVIIGKTLPTVVPHAPRETGMPARRKYEKPKPIPPRKTAG